MKALKSNVPVSPEELIQLQILPQLSEKHSEDPPDQKWWSSSWSVFRAVISVKENLRLPQEVSPSSAPLAREEWENLIQKDWIR